MTCEWASADINAVTWNAMEIFYMYVFFSFSATYTQLLVLELLKVSQKSNLKFPFKKNT